MPTITYGSQDIPLIERPEWQPVTRCPYRNLRELTPTTTWFDLTPVNPETVWETHVAQPSGVALPPSLLAAQEWMNAGARRSYVVEAWDGPEAVMRADLHGPHPSEPIHELINQFIAMNGGLIGGFPDVVGFWDNGRISLQELKHNRKDHLKPNQHAAADRLRALLGDRLDLSVMVWG